MGTETTRSTWLRAFATPDADWRLPATDIWPSFTLSARERQDLAARLEFTVAGWIIANAPLDQAPDAWLAKWRRCSLAEWYDRLAPSSDLYGLLAEELVGLWMKQAEENLPRVRADVVIVDLEDWAKLMREVWDDEDTPVSTEPIVCCYLELIRRHIDGVTVGAAWNNSLKWWQASVKSTRVLPTVAASSFSASD